MKYTMEEIQDAYSNSSPKIQKVLNDNWVAESATQIGEEEKLRIDKVDILIRIIGLTLLNIIGISQFIKTLETELAIDSEKANKIAQKIDKLIFQKVRKTIMEEESSQGEVEKEVVKDEINGLIEDIENKADDHSSFKDKFNKVTVKKVEERVVDPYREAID